MGLGSRLITSLAHFGCPTTRALEHTLCAPPTASSAPTHTPTRPAAASCARARAQALSGVTDACDLGRGLAHHFPCSLWVVPPLGLLNTHFVHLPPQARPPHTHPPALLRPAARARARAGTRWAGMHGTW
eukprot:6514776-Prymnesium_polylepis.1